LTLAQLIPVLLQVSLALIVFGLGLRTLPSDLTYLLRQPALLVRSVLSMNVVMPLVAAGIAAGFKLEPQVELALVLLAVSPVPPVLPSKQMKAGGSASYAIGLLALSAVLAIAAVPLSVAAIGRWFGLTLTVPASLIARVVGGSVFAPLLAGVLVRQFGAGFAERASQALSTVGSAVLGVTAIGVLAGSWPALTWSVGHFTVVAVMVFVLVSLGVGHLLGGPDEDDRTVLALSTASRHPGVAMAIAGALAPDNKAIPAAVMLAFLVGLVLTGPYTKWRTGRSAKH